MGLIQLFCQKQLPAVSEKRTNESRVCAPVNQNNELKKAKKTKRAKCDTLGW